jgi:hypothetical protein
LPRAFPSPKEPDDKAPAFVGVLANERQKENVLANLAISGPFFGELTPDEEEQAAALAAPNETKETRPNRPHYEILLLLLFASVFLRDLRG